MQGILSFAIMLLAIGFAIIVFYICYLLIRVSTSVRVLGETANKMEEKLKFITPELKNTIRETDRLVDDMDEKLKATDSVVDTIENVGTSVQTINQVYAAKKKRTSDEEIFKQAKPFIEGIKWSEVAIRLYSKWKTDKPPKETQLVVKNKETNVIPLKQTGKEG